MCQLHLRCKRICSGPQALFQTCLSPLLAISSPCSKVLVDFGGCLALDLLWALCLPKHYHHCSSVSQPSPNFPVVSFTHLPVPLPTPLFLSISTSTVACLFPHLPWLVTSPLHFHLLVSCLPRSLPLPLYSNDLDWKGKGGNFLLFFFSSFSGQQLTGVARQLPKWQL